MADRSFRLGPIALTTTLTTNILNPPSTSGGTGVGTLATRIRLRHIRIINKTGTAATFSLWLGATNGNAAGTEVIGQGYSVAANSAFDWYGDLEIDTTDFLVGGAGTGTALTLEAEGIIQLV